MRFNGIPVLAVLTMLLASPAAASPVAPPAGPPVATTGAATAIGSTGATLNGSVDPNKHGTTATFDCGTTANYSATVSAGTITGNGHRSVSVTISGLTPSTVYHFRLTASNPSGPSTGQDVTFTTAAAGTPAYGLKSAVSIAATPGTVTYGHPTVVSGRVTAPKSAPKKSGGVRVTLQAQPFPFTTPFEDTGTVTSAGPNGHYSFTVVPGVRTHCQVVANTAPPAPSAVVVVNVRYAVSLHVSARTVHRGARVRFLGSVHPAANGRTVYIQRRSRSGHWHRVAKTVLRSTTSSTRSRYNKRHRVLASGTYRVHIRGQGGYSASNSRPRTITVF